MATGATLEEYFLGGIELDLGHLRAFRGDHVLCLTWVDTTGRAFVGGLSASVNAESASTLPMSLREIIFAPPQRKNRMVMLKIKVKLKYSATLIALWVIGFDFSQARVLCSV